LIFERAARRGGLPLAYSAGFTPHPKIAFGSGLPVGYGSEVELLDIELKELISPGELVDRYNSGMPDGLVVLAAVPLARGVQSLGVLIEEAEYEVGCTAPWVGRRLEEFLALSSYEIEKPYKGGTRRDDLRKGVLHARAHDGGFSITCAIKPRAVRPSDVFTVLEGLESVTGTAVSYQRTALLSRRAGKSVFLTEHTDEVKVAS
jgi:radical SAM-linked protein